MEKEKQRINNNERAAKYRKAHPDRLKESYKKWFDKLPADRKNEMKEQARLRTREWNKNNKERKIQQVMKYAKEHPEKVLEYKRRWKESHPEAIVAAQKRRSELRPEVVRAANQRARISQDNRNVCISCGNKRDVGKRCAVCKKKRSDEYADSVAKGICVTCRKPAVVNCTHCEVCRIKSVWHASKKHKYNGICLSIDDFIVWYRENEIRSAGCCDWCGEAFKLGKRPSVDHNHTTGEPRALVCNLCNVAEGFGANRLRFVLRAKQRSDDFVSYSAMPELCVYDIASIRRKLQSKLCTSKHSAKKGNYKPIVISLDEFVVWYVNKLAITNGCCEWCHEPFGKRGPVVDHSHSTGLPRALLCNLCNFAEAVETSRIEKVLAAIDKWSV